MIWAKSPSGSGRHYAWLSFVRSLCEIHAGSYQESRLVSVSEVGVSYLHEVAISEMCIEKRVVCEPCRPGVAAAYDAPTRQVRARGGTVESELYSESVIEHLPSTMGKLTNVCEIPNISHPNTFTDFFHVLSCLFNRWYCAKTR